MDQIAEIIGWIGTGVYLLAYFLLSIGKLKGDKPFFHILNLVGAAGLVAHANHIKDRQSFTVNLFWGIFALLAIYGIIRQRAKVK